jgi:hypothetical protein
MVSQEVAFAQSSSQKTFYDFIKFAHPRKQGVSLQTMAGHCGLIGITMI